MAKAETADTDKPPLTLEAYKKLFDTARDEMTDGRKDSDLSRDFYDGDQWTREEESIILGRGQVPIKINRVQRAIDGIMGVVESNKTDPRALMRNPPDEQQNPQAGAIPSPQATPVQPGMSPQPAGPQQPQKKPLDAGDVATMTLRYVADTTHFKSTTKMDVLETGLVEGCGAAIVEVDGKKEITCTQIRWEEFFYDPKSRRFDFQDARYKGIAKWMYADDVAALYPNSKTEIDQIQGDGAQGLGLDATFDDRPREGKQPWVDKKLQRLMVVDMYHLYQGQWWRCVFFAGGKLESGVSAYLDDDGKPCCPIEAWSCYINRKNERYGVVKSMRDPQKEVNLRRSKAVHEINTRQLQRVDMSAPPVDVDLAKKEANDPNGIIPTGYQVVPRQDIIANNVEMMQEAKSELERMGAAPSVLARQGADASGRAQQIRVQTGLQELARVFNRHGEWERSIYRQFWWRAKQFYDAPMWIRVTGDNDAPQYVRINEPVPPQMPSLNPATGQPDLRYQQAPQIKNHIAKMDVDIVLDKTPDTATLEQEIWNELMDFAKAFPQLIPPQILLEASQLPKKRELIDKLEAAQAAQAPQQQMAMQAQMAKFAADIAEIQSTIRKNNTQADLNEANTVVTAAKGHLEVNRAAQLPPGITINNSGTPVPVVPPPPGGNSGASGPPP